MSPSPTLVIMAAGAARRYGGLKQLAPVGPAGEALMEYSIFDAVRSGFNKVVLVVRREFESQFREKFTARASRSVEIAFAYQDSDSFVSASYDGPARAKPWGTAHAVLCAKPEVAGAFGVINADDFYGRTAFEVMGQFLNSHTTRDDQIAAMVGYQLANTLSDHGTVNRGVTEVDPEGSLIDIVERFDIARRDDSAICRDANGMEHVLPLDTIVSMNLWGYPAAMMEHLKLGFEAFLASEPNPSTEFEVPTFTKQLINSGALRVQVLDTDEKWCGMTYQDDLPLAQARIAAQVAAGIYPRELW